MKVLLTGATGYIAEQLIPALRAEHELRMVDVKVPDSGVPSDVQVVDLLHAPPGELEKLFADVDTVVHCAYHRADTRSTQQEYEAERLNIDLMQKVYQLSMECGVRRVVSASTNQAARWYEKPFSEGKKDRVTSEDYPRPDGFYGWAKAAYESLGFVYACGSLGRKLEVIQIRIVVPREIDGSRFVDQPAWRYIRELAGYISERDLQQLFCRSISTVDIQDQHGVPFHIFYGVSNNARTFWSISNAREVVGYAPEDDSERRFANDITRILYAR